MKNSLAARKGSELGEGGGVLSRPGRTGGAGGRAGADQVVWGLAYLAKESELHFVGKRKNQWGFLVRGKHAYCCGSCLSFPFKETSQGRK